MSNSKTFAATLPLPWHGGPSTSWHHISLALIMEKQMIEI